MAKTFQRESEMSRILARLACALLLAVGVAQVHAEYGRRVPTPWTALEWDSYVVACRAAPISRETGFFNIQDHFDQRVAKVSNGCDFEDVCSSLHTQGGTCTDSHGDAYQGSIVCPVIIDPA